MAATSDVIAQDGPGNIKLHPYLVALVRWCVSCLWSTANILIHRLLTTPLPPINASRPPKPRAAGTDHLHPEPRVDCVVLHAPARHNIDVIFIHGLYGSLGNTWRQGDWRPKYKIEPNKIPLIDNSNSCECEKQRENEFNKSNHYESKIHDESYKDNFYKNMKILPNEDVFITEKFYNNTLLNQVEIVDNYEIQANFVRDLFKKECDNCDIKSDEEEKDEVIGNNDCECGSSEARQCEVGCGCVCDLCYSSCWPRDWIKVDYPDARVISINYTSDPYLWRPLWVKGNKRLRLHERAEQMTRQLLDMGVGEKPIIWVGHSKGGLFIKQIYCEAYEAYLKTQETKSKIPDVNSPQLVIDNNNRENIDCDEDNTVIQDVNSPQFVIDNNNRENKDCDDNTVVTISGGKGNVNEGDGERREATSPSSEEDVPPSLRSGLWRNSCGFMFYSVPHRGSPLADIKTPITARSIELLEISKDCALVLSLQERWLRATAPLRPAVRSLVETTRTLMSVLWLRIVSVTSADAGIGALYGVSVDHREICKPSSRYCLLYTELMNLMKTALNKCRCQ